MKKQKWLITTTRSGELDTSMVTGTVKQVKKYLADEVKDFIINCINCKTDYEDISNPDVLEEAMSECDITGPVTPEEIEGRGEVLRADVSSLDPDETAEWVAVTLASVEAEAEDLSKPKTPILDEAVSYTKGNYRIELAYIGEGYEGDYDENDKDDEPLLRADLYRKEDGEWFDEPEASCCTSESARITKTEAKKLAGNILKNYINIVPKIGKSVSISNALVDSLNAV